MTVLTRMYYRRKDHKVGYETFSSLDPDLNLQAKVDGLGGEKMLYSLEYKISVLSLNLDQTESIPLANTSWQITFDSTDESEQRVG